MSRTKCTQAERSAVSLVRRYCLSCLRAWRRSERHLGVEPRGEGASTNLGRMRRKKPVDEASHGCFVDGEDVGNRKVIQNGRIDDGWDIEERRSEGFPVEIPPTSDLPSKVGWRIVEEWNGDFDDTVIGDGWRMDAEVGGHAIVACDDDVEPAAASVSRACDMLDQAELVSNDSKVGCIRGRHILEAKV